MSKKFDVAIGNPPYQNGREQVYTSFYTGALDVADNVCMIFPTGWQDAKTANGLSRMNNKEIKRDPQIVNINNIQNAFVGVAGAEWTNILLWRKDYDNGLKGKQKVYTEGINEKEVLLPINKEDIPKPDFIVELSSIVSSHQNYQSIKGDISPRRPYGLTSDIWHRYEKYDLPPLLEVDSEGETIRIYTSDGLYFVNKNYPFPRITEALNKYKVFTPKAWGNMSEQNGFGGAYANIFIAHPDDACSETYLECGGYDSKGEANYLAKYLMTSFARALMYLNKYSQNNARGAYDAIPQQDFTEDWWDLSVEEIDEKLFEKYNVPDEIKMQVYDNIQKRSEDNIIDYGPQNKEMS